MKNFDYVKEYQGGLSDDVIYSYRAIEYLSNNKYAAGYFGATNRSPRRDKIVEKCLREVGLDNNGIAYWLTSTSGRHLMDDPGKNLNEFKQRVKKYTERAFIEVLIWSHPDHRGTIKSTNDLLEKIKGIL